MPIAKVAKIGFHNSSLLISVNVWKNDPMITINTLEVIKRKVSIILVGKDGSNIGIDENSFSNSCNISDSNIGSNNLYSGYGSKLINLSSYVLVVL